ncbi:MAG TPA: branched-chain amino acid ABC transporter substrate-binding protein [Aestuariivirga sp.]|nr:branched-chain amino acid ABC transporter substrate-binding protein [Aestuariivirga sp.]
MRALLPVLFMLGLFAGSARADILVAAQGPMKGAYGALGTALASGTEAGVTAINAGGGINGEMLAFAPADDNCDVTRAAAVARELIARDVRLVVGPLCAAAAQAAAPLYAEAGVVMISPTISDPGFTAGSALTLRLAGRDDAQADLALARLARDLPGGRVAVVGDGSPLATALTAKFTTALGSRAVAFAVKAGEADYGGLIKDMGEVAAVYFAAMDPGDAGLIARQVNEAGQRPLLLGSDTLLDAAYLKAAGASASDTRVTFPADPLANPAARAVAESLMTRGVVAEGPVLPSYAAVEVFAAAARAGKVNDGAGLARWLRGAKDIATVLGPLSFDAHGDLTPPPFVWYKAAAGGFVRDSQ